MKKSINSNITIALVNRKGGTGKTTSAAYIAEILSTRKRTVGIDLDEDASWLKLKSMGGLNYDVIKGDKDNLDSQIASLKCSVVIDTPPNDEAVIYKVAVIADEVIVPVALTLLDLGRLLSTTKTIASVEKIRGKALTSVMLTRWRSNLNVSKDGLEALKSQQTPLLDNTIRDLARYKENNIPTYLDEYEAVLKELELI